MLSGCSHPIKLLRTESTKYGFNLAWRHSHAHALSLSLTHPVPERAQSTPVLHQYLDMQGTFICFLRPLSIQVPIAGPNKQPDFSTFPPPRDIQADFFKLLLCYCLL